MKRNPSPLLTGVGVVLRPLRTSDVDRIVEACGDSRTQHWLGRMPSPYTSEDARTWLHTTRETAAEGTTITWAIADPETDDLTDAINLFDIEPGSQAEVGYWAHPAIRGRGLSSEACRLAVEHGFASLDVDTVIAHTALENTASQHVLEANGLRRVRVVPGGTMIRSGRVDAVRHARCRTNPQQR